jgi:hypothetical protein
MTETATNKVAFVEKHYPYIRVGIRTAYCRRYGPFDKPVCTDTEEYVDLDPYYAKEYAHRILRETGTLAMRPDDV